MKLLNKCFSLYLIIALSITGFSVSAEAAEKGERELRAEEQIKINAKTVSAAPASADAISPTKVILPTKTMEPTKTMAPTKSPTPTELPEQTTIPTPTGSPFESPTPGLDEKPAPPILHTATADEKGIRIIFSSVEGAQSYSIYIRKVGSGREFTEISELAADRYEAVMAQGGVFLSVEEEDVEIGESYEIMVRSSKRYIVSEDSNIIRADMPQQIVTDVTAKALSQSSAKIEWDMLQGVNGYEIQYSLTENGPYQTAVILSDDSVTSWVHRDLEIGTTYYYKVYALGEVTKSYTASVVKCLVTFEKPKGIQSTMAGPAKMKLSWQKVSGADGYIIYRSETKNEWSKGKPKKYKVLRGEKKTKLTVPKVKNGRCYHYEIMAYAVKKGVTIEGNVASYNRYADYYGHENESYQNRWKRIYQNKKTEYDHRKSGKYMTTIRVKVWDFARGMSGRKVTKVKTFSVHKKIAPTMKKIFQEIYRGKERAPIYEIGGYSARSGQHGQGLAIDLNSNYNYMVQGKKILAGSCWKPGRYAYSIKRNGDIEKAFRKYGYSRGLWGSRKDYMHFSYFGT